MVKFDEYSNMITKQNNRCAVCETLQHGRKYNSFKVDRDPKTNAPRGLVCKRCYSLLKLVDGDLTTLNNMLNYLANIQEVMNQTELQNRIPELQERLRELREVVIPNLIEEEQWLESELTRVESRLYNLIRNT